MKLKILVTAALLTLILPVNGATAPESDVSKLGILTRIAGEYAAIGQNDKAEELLAQALPLVQAISNDCDKSEPIAAIAGQYAKAGQQAKAKELLDQAIRVANAAKNCLSHNDVVENLADIQNRYVQEGQYDLALQTVRGLNNENEVFKIYGLSLIAHHFADTGQVDKSSALLTEIVKVAQSLKDAHAQAFALARSAVEYAKAGQNAQAIELLNQAMKVAPTINNTNEGKSNVLVGIARGYAQVGQTDQAIKALDQALPIAKTMSNPDFKFHALGEIAVQYAAVNQKAKATEIFGQLQSMLQTGEPAFKSISLSSLAHFYANSGQYEQALRIAQTIKDVQEKAGALSRIAGHYARKGQFESALQVAQTISDANHKAGALSEIVRSYAEAGQLDQALKVAQTIERKFDKTMILSEMAVNYAEAGKPDRAIQIAQTIKDIMSSTNISNEEKDIDWMLPAIVSSYAKAGQFDQALKVAQNIQGKPYKVNALSDIAGQYAARQQKDKAAALLAEALQIIQPISPRQ